MKLINYIKALLVAPFLYLVGGTPYGKAAYFKFAKTIKAEAWTLIELSAADREKLRVLAEQISTIEDIKDRGQQWIYMKMQVIASCAVNSRGWYLYDPLNINHLNAISDYPDRLIEQALGAIDDLNDMPWLVVREQLENNEECEPVNP